MSNTEETTVVTEASTETITEAVLEEATDVQEPTTPESTVPQVKKNKRTRSRVSVAPEASTTSSRQRELKPIGHSGKLSYTNS